VLRKLFSELNLTRQEQGVVLFLLFSLLVGSIVEVFDKPTRTITAENEALVNEFLEISQRLREEEEMAGAEADSLSEVPGGFTVLDLNSASVSELMELPRIGPVVASRIIEYREKNGKFMNVSDLTKVKGVGSVTLRRIESLVTVE
jgi:competence ComEA-like helix-hairpin-helix protein